MKKLLLIALVILGMQSQAQCWKQIDAGQTHICGIKLDGSLWGWGNSGEGQLGVGNMGEENVLITRIGNDNNWKSLSAGAFHTIALKTDGTLWACGRNLWGQLGIGTNDISYDLIKIGDDSDWSSIYCKSNFTFAIKSNGTLWACGDNSYGQLGDNTNINRNVFIQVGTDNDWKMVAPGQRHTVALKNNGTLWAWGNNTDGALGNGNTNTGVLVYSPIQIGVSTDWDYVISGNLSSFALKTDKSLWSWGLNYYGVLGYIIQEDTDIPRQVDDNQWKNISLCDNTAIAVREDGTLWGWGDNYDGAVGDGTYTDQYIPVLIDNNTDWKSAVTSGFSSFAFKSSGELWGWGANYFGLITPASITAINYPVFTNNCAAMNTNENIVTMVSLYPNPVTNILHIQIPGNTGIDSVIITDITGKTVLQQNYTSEINVAQLPAGMYFATVLTRGQTQTLKFIKQ